MCALIAMAVYSTEENKKDQYLDKTLDSLKNTVDFTRHRLMLSVNAQTPITRLIFKKYADIISDIIYNDTNIGTAEAINKVWQFRSPHENAIKMDDDCGIYQAGWVDMMEDICWNNPDIGQVGLKRPDLWERPDHENEFYRSEMIKVKLTYGDTIVERCHHIMGTCVMHSANLLSKVGYMWQPALYGFDDVYMSLRSDVCGFKNVFLKDWKIDHLDPGDTPFQKWKEAHTIKWLTDEHQNRVEQYRHGEIEVYYNPFI